jgi:hypothetical protein
LAEDFDVFRTGWQQQRICSKVDWRSSSLSVWPDIQHVVILKRLDVYVCESPPSQQATTDPEESRLIRNTPGWLQFMTIFVINEHMYMTKDFLIESAGPPRRCRVSKRCFQPEMLHLSALSP